MSSGHSHALPEDKNESTLWFALGLTACFLIAEVVAGLLLNSLALLADAAHMFTDVVALAIALAAVRVARRPADAKRTYGYHRFEILAAAFNALLLFGVAIYILYEAWQRFRSPAEVQSTGMLVVAVFGLVINLISMRLLSGGKDGSLNVKGAYLEVWSDMLGSIGVIVAAIVIRFTGWAWVDTVVAVGIGLWVLPRTWTLLKESMNILLEGVPEGVDIDAVSAAMLAVPGVTGVHDLHLWALTSGKNSLTAHVVHAESSQPQTLRAGLQDVLADHFKVFHTTLQLEHTPCQHSDDGCNYVARKDVRHDLAEASVQSHLEPHHERTGTPTFLRKVWVAVPAPHKPGRMLVPFALALAGSACTAPYEGRHDFYAGWREAEITRIDTFEKLSSSVVPRCSAGPSAQMTDGATWAVVRYRLSSRTRFVAVPVPPSERFTVGENVYANVSACSPELRKRAAVG